MSDLPRDLLEEILSRLPFTCMRAVRLTCKSWNTLSKTQSFVEKHIGEETSREFSVIMMMMDYEVSLMGVNFSGIHNKVMELKGKLITSDSVDILFHCDGLLLLVMKDHKKRLVVWNPYCGQHKRIQPRKFYHYTETYAMGYKEKKDKSCSHKILRIFDVNIGPYEMYDFKSDSWSVLAINTPLDGGNNIRLCGNAISLKGNTYWIATEKPGTFKKNFLLCFDFTKERLGPRLSLPLDCYFPDSMVLSSGRKEHIPLLFNEWGTSKLEIWVTSKITPNTVSWSKFLAVDMRPFIARFYRSSLMRRRKSLLLLVETTIES